MNDSTPYGAGRHVVIMKKLVAGGLLVALVAFAGTAFADDGTLQDRELQRLFESSVQVTHPAGAQYDPLIGLDLKSRETRKLFEWSAQAAESAKQNALTAGPGTHSTSIPAYIEYQGLDSN